MNEVGGVDEMGVTKKWVTKINTRETSRENFSEEEKQLLYIPIILHRRDNKNGEKLYEVVQQKFIK